MNAKDALLLAMALFAIVFLTVFIPAVVRAFRTREQSPIGEAGMPSVLELAVGFVTNFFDTLGIGSFAPSTSVFKLWRMVPDRLIPGTLNVGHLLPTVTQATIFMSIVEVDSTTLISMIAASVLGAWLGAGIVAGWSKRNVRIGMGLALIVAATLMLMTNLNLFPGGGTALSLTGGRLIAAIVANFALGALMTLGIGLYAPCMITISLLGMNPLAAFPIMMGSCAFLMVAASVRFLRENCYSLKPALGLLLGGIPGVLIAAFIVKSLPMTTVRWLVVVVVIYTAVSMLRSVYQERHLPEAKEVAPA